VEELLKRVLQGTPPEQREQQQREEVKKNQP
jgi:hypothetical protein